MEVWVDIELVGYVLGFDTLHVLIMLYKHIPILLKKLDQSLANLVIENRTNVDDSVRELVIQYHWY